jgi:hypothetical protein
MKAFPLSGVVFIVVVGGVVMVRGGAGKARKGGFLTGVRTLRYFSDSALGNERERERECERPNRLLLMPNASASIDRVEGSLARFLTNMYRPFASRSIHLLPESGSMD